MLVLFRNRFRHVFGGRGGGDLSVCDVFDKSRLQTCCESQRDRLRLFSLLIGIPLTLYRCECLSVTSRCSSRL